MMDRFSESLVKHKPFSFKQYSSQTPKQANGRRADLELSMAITVMVTAGFRTVADRSVFRRARCTLSWMNTYWEPAIYQAPSEVLGLKGIFLLKIGYFAHAFEELTAWLQRQAKRGKFHGCTEQS